MNYTVHFIRLWAAAAAMLSVAGAQQIRVIVNDQPVTFTASGPKKVGGRILVPLRGVLEQLGAYVTWDPNTQTVVATKGDTDIELVIGSLMGRVNGRATRLDVPAQVYRGTTLVPLRFMSEALGMDVRWDEPNQAVFIMSRGEDVRVPPNTDVGDSNMGVGGGNPATVSITSFESSASGWLRPGAPVTFTLVGSPGGVATFQIPGVTGEIPMTEARPGQYVGTWTPPTGEQAPLNIGKAGAIARLRIGTAERLIQAGSSVSFDNQPPKITAVAPEPNGKITRSQPSITAVFDDGTGSGLNPDSVVLRLDGQNITRQATVTNGFIAFKPATRLEPGPHTISVAAADRAGNAVERSWAFVIATDSDVIKSFTHTGTQNVEPGDVIRFTLIGQAGGKASYSIGRALRNQPMTEVQPGQYIGEYTVRKGDNFANLVATARLTASDGETYTVDSSQSLQVNTGTPDVPKISSPVEGATVASPLVITGKALPGSRVEIVVNYRTSVLGGLNLSGELADVIVEADDKGNFTTEPINLDTLVRGRGTTFTIVAVTLGENNKKSDSTKVTVKL